MACRDGHHTRIEMHPGGPMSRDGCRTAGCTTQREVVCTCGWAQGALSDEHARVIAEGHSRFPTADVISSVTGMPVTA
jgi:hypothetical protein